MLPHSHVALTLLAFDLVQQRSPALKKADVRLLALAASGPDLIDKPLAAVYFYGRFKSAMLFAHTLLAQLGVAVMMSRVPGWWPYLLAFLAHGLQDRLWMFRDTFWWPLRGWNFHVWSQRGSEQTDIKRAYWYAFTRRPELWVWEILGLLAIVWLVWRHQLYRPARLWHLLYTGRWPA